MDEGVEHSLVQVTRVRSGPVILRWPTVKRVLDVATAILLLILLSLPLLLLALAVKLESRGLVLYRSRRIGLGGREFAMLKFRKMHRDATGPLLTAQNDDRFTRVGAFLARTKLDELPQLWNVLRGEMSFVGPRPEDPSFAALYPEDFAGVLRAKPGITGLSQLAFAKEARILARPELAGSYAQQLLPGKIRIDLLYVERRSLALDARILVWTVAALVFGLDVAVDRSTGRLSVRRPHDVSDASGNTGTRVSGNGRNGDISSKLLQRARVRRSDGFDGMCTVILAGGKGTRLMPYTSVLPKPLMPLGDRALLEIVIRQLARHGLLDITLLVGHLAHLIEAVFGDGADHGVKIRYVREDSPLGTAGPLRLVDGLDDTFLMLNGDIVTTLDYREMVRAHRAAGNLLTIATRERKVEIDYGVLELDAAGGRHKRISSFREKPSLDVVVSMGIYLIEPEALEFIPDEGYFDFPDLVRALLQAEAPVGSFGHDGLWLDIGRHEDYDQAVSLLETGELALLDEEFRAASPESSPRPPSNVVDRRLVRVERRAEPVDRPPQAG